MNEGLHDLGFSRLLIFLLCEARLNVNLNVELRLQIKHELKVILIEKEDVQAILSNATSSPRAMYETIDVSAATLNYYINVIDVQATGSHICCH